MKITDHIYFYQNPEGSFIESSGSVVIVGDNKQIIIDPGTNIKKRLDYLIKEMKDDDLNIDGTDEIWLTHAHPDHYQAIYDLFKRFGREKKVRCHPLGQSILNSFNWRNNFITQEKRKAGPYWKLLVVPGDRKKIDSGNTASVLEMIREGIAILWQKIEKIDNIEPFFDTETIKVSPLEIQVLFLPGHTPDEIGFWIPKEKILISGDLINVFQRKDGDIECKLVLYNFYADLDQAIESLKKIKQIEEKMPEILLTPHSIPVKGRENIQEILHKLILKIDDYRTAALRFIAEHPGFNGIRLVKEFAKALPDGNLLLIEKRFIALTVLKSLGRID